MKRLFFLSCPAILLLICLVPVNQALADDQKAVSQETSQLAPRAVKGVFIYTQFNPPHYYAYQYQKAGKGYMVVNKDGLSAKIDFANATEADVNTFNEVSRQLGFPCQAEYDWSGYLLMKKR